MADLQFTIPVNLDWQASDVLRLLIGTENAADLSNSSPVGGSIRASKTIGDLAGTVANVVLVVNHLSQDKCAALPWGVAIDDSVGNRSAVVEGIAQIADPPRGVNDLAVAATLNPNEAAITWTQSPDVSGASPTLAAAIDLADVATAMPPFAGGFAPPYYRMLERPAKDGADLIAAVLPPGTENYTYNGPNSTSRYIYLRTVSRCGVTDIEPVLPKLRRVAYDAVGNLILPVPNAPIGLQLDAKADGQVVATWAYVDQNQAVAPATLNVYVATGVNVFDFNTPSHVVAFALGTRLFTADLGSFSNATTVRCVVRAVSAALAQEDNIIEVSAVADDLAPDTPAGVVVGVL